MPEPMLIDEAEQRAIERMQSLMTLVQISFDAGEAQARRIAAETELVTDPVATCCFGEARRLLVTPAPNFGKAMLALLYAAQLEPECYGPTKVAICELLFDGIDEAADAELAAASESGHQRKAEPPASL